MVHAGEGVGGRIKFCGEQDFDFVGPDVAEVFTGVELVDVPEKLVNERAVWVVINRLRFSDLFDAGVARQAVRQIGDGPRLPARSIIRLRR